MANGQHYKHVRWASLETERMRRNCSHVTGTTTVLVDLVLVLGVAHQIGTLEEFTRGSRGRGGQAEGATCQSVACSRWTQSANSINWGLGFGKDHEQKNRSIKTEVRAED